MDTVPGYFYLLFQDVLDHVNGLVIFASCCHCLFATLYFLICEPGGIVTPLFLSYVGVLPVALCCFPFYSAETTGYLVVSVSALSLTFLVSRICQNQLVSPTRL
jgi:hypothetical protein